MGRGRLADRRVAVADGLVTLLFRTWRSQLQRGLHFQGLVESSLLKKGIGKDAPVIIVRVRPLWDKELESGDAGDNVGCLLRGLKRDDVQRGQVLCKPNTLKPIKKVRHDTISPARSPALISRTISRQSPSRSPGEVLSSKTIAVGSSWRKAGHLASAPALLSCLLDGKEGPPCSTRLLRAEQVESRSRSLPAVHAVSHAGKAPAAPSQADR